jgi:hypothetical protein
MKGINRINNAILLHTLLYLSFGDFACAFKAIPNRPHAYQLRTYKHTTTELTEMIKVKFFPPEFTFSNADDLVKTELLPHPVLLDYHYRLAEIFSETEIGAPIVEGIDRSIERDDDYLTTDGLSCLNGVLIFINLFF